MSPQQTLLNPGDLDKHRAQLDAAITAGSWNALRSAILAAYSQADALAMQPGYITVTVRERGTDALAPATSIASIQAQPEGQADSQIPVLRLGGRFFVGLLDPGVYRVTVTPTQDSGFATQARSVVRAFRPACGADFLLGATGAGQGDGAAAVWSYVARGAQSASGRRAAAWPGGRYPRPGRGRDPGRVPGRWLPGARSAAGDGRSGLARSPGKTWRWTPRAQSTW